MRDGSLRLGVLARAFLRVRSDARLRLPAALALPLAVMAGGLGEPVHGTHLFRQAHVAANIEKFVEAGPSLRPRTYNLDAPASLYDFPLYQLVAAGASRTLGTAPLPTARAVGIAAFVLAVFILDGLLRRTAVRPAHALLGLVLFAWAPLVVFFFSAPIVDGLAVTLGLASVLGYARWAGTGRPADFMLMLAAGVLSALVKNPVYLPFLVAIAWHRARARGLRALAAPGFLALLGAVGLAVLGFKLFANHVNGVAGWLGAGEAEAYFGTLLDHLTWTDSWSRIVATLTLEVLNPVTAALAVIALVAYARRGRGGWRHLHLGAALGGATAVLVFFNRHRGHDYYQLPLVPACAFFAGYGLYRLLLAARRPGAGRGPALALVAVAAVSLAAAWLGLQRVGRGEVPDDSTVEMAESGCWIQRHTEPSDFVVYLLDTHPGDWNPAWLYFAHRDGYNLSHVEVRRPALERLAERFAPRYRRVLVFCPAYLVPRLGRKLDAWGLHPLHVSALGRLYVLEAARLSADATAGARPPGTRRAGRGRC
jgi:hypothetical protein